MISHQNEHVGTAQRRQHHRLRNLSRLVNHAVVESSLREKRVLHPQARAANNPMAGTSDRKEGAAAPSMQPRIPRYVVRGRMPVHNPEKKVFNRYNLLHGA